MEQIWAALYSTVQVDPYGVDRANTCMGLAERGRQRPNRRPAGALGHWRPPGEGINKGCTTFQLCHSTFDMVAPGPEGENKGVQVAPPLHRMQYALLALWHG